MASEAKVLETSRIVDGKGDGTKDKDYIPLRKKSNADKAHIADQDITWANWYHHINWLNVTVLLISPAIGCVWAYWTPLQLYTAIFSILYYFNTGLGITAGMPSHLFPMLLTSYLPTDTFAGYHRLWAHKSYQATLPLKIYLIAVGSGAIEGSIRWWSRGHRAHHRYTDTEKDPYSVNKGLLYSHMGWLVMKQNPKRVGRADISDLDADPLIVWQHTNFVKCLLFMAFGFPTLVCGLGWGDWVGGFLYAGILRVFFVQRKHGPNVVFTAL